MGLLNENTLVKLTDDELCTIMMALEVTIESLNKAVKSGLPFKDEDARVIQETKELFNKLNELYF
jgi:hypothetical protein